MSKNEYVLVADSQIHCDIILLCKALFWPAFNTMTQNIDLAEPPWLVKILYFCVSFSFSIRISFFGHACEHKQGI